VIINLSTTSKNVAALLCETQNSFILPKLTEISLFLTELFLKNTRKLFYF